jgi:hypothetical protein
MAMTGTVTRVEQGNKMFQGMFKEMWAVTGTLDTGGDLTDGDGLLATITVPGVAVGDMVIGFSVGATPHDADGQTTITAHVTAANTVTFTAIASTANVTDPLADSALKLLIGRPAW